MRLSGRREQQSLPAAFGRRCQLPACASPTEITRRPLLAQTSALIGQHDGKLSASWIASPRMALRMPRRRQVCRRQPGKVTAVTGTREPARADSRGYQITDNFRLPASQRKEFRARVAERKARAEKPLPGSPEAAAVILILKSSMPAFVKDTVLMMGLSVYWDLTEVAAHAEYTGDWEAIELPLEMFFQRGMSEDQILAGRENWFKSTADLTLRTRAESRSKKKNEAPSKGLASVATPKGSGGAAAPKGFGGGEARPSRGRKKKAPAPAAKKHVKSQDALLYELEMKARAQEREREQQAWNQYVAWLESFFGPMTDDEVGVFLSQKTFWDVADDLFHLAVDPAMVSLFMGCSMEYGVRLLRSLRFVFVVVFVPTRVRETSEASKAPEEEKVSSGQSLLSGVGTALRDALTFRKGASRPGSPGEAGATLEDARQLSQQERGQGLLERLEAVDRVGVPAELAEATALRRIIAIEDLLSPGFRWWQERGARLLGEPAAGMPGLMPNFPTETFPEEALLGRAEAPEGPAAAVSGVEGKDETKSSTFPVSSIGDESAQLSDHSLEATQAPQELEEHHLGDLQEGSELEAVQDPSGVSAQPADALQASMQDIEQAEAVDQSSNSDQSQGPPEQPLEALQQQTVQSQPALQGSEQAVEALDQSPAALQHSIGALDRPPLGAVEPSAEIWERVQETSQQAEAQDSRPGPSADAQAASTGPAESVEQVREASGQLRRTSQPPELPKQAPAEDMQAPDRDQQGSSGGWPINDERPADVSQPSRPQPLRLRDSAEELDASAMGPRARRLPAARAKHPRSRDGWTSLPEPAPEREPERPPAPVRAPAARATAPSAPWQPRIRVQPPAFHEGAYMAPQLLPGDRRDWKAAGVLAYSVDETGVHLLLGKIDQRLSYSPPRAKELGWWILGGKRSGADYSAEATAVREMFEETAGLLSGRDVSGGQLSEVLWYPNAGYALFPLYIPGKPDIPRAYNHKMAERERVRRRTIRRVAAGPRPMSKLGWVPLKTIMERRCKLHLVLEAILRKTSLVSYLQQMQQLIGEQVGPQARPIIRPPGASYGGPTPLVPRSLKAPSSARVEDGSGSYGRGRPLHGEGPSASRWAGAATEPRRVTDLGRVPPAASDEPGTPAAEATPATPSAASVNSSAAADERRASAAVPAAGGAALAVARAASGSNRRREDPRPTQAGPAGCAASSSFREGISPKELAEHAARAAGRAELEESDPEGRKAPLWERDLHAPKPYKPAIIRRGRRRLKRRVS